MCGQLSYDLDRCLSVGQSPRRTEAVGRCSEQAHVQAGKAGMVARGTGEIDAVARLLEHVVHMKEASVHWCMGRVSKGSHNGRSGHGGHPQRLHAGAG